MYRAVVQKNAIKSTHMSRDRVCHIYSLFVFLKKAGQIISFLIVFIKEIFEW